jgi:hypothetical protein
MKMQSFLLLLLPFFACQNRKAHLVDMQKMYFDSASYYQRVTEQEMMKNINDSALTTQQRFKIDQENMSKAIKCKEIVDSIGWELKKY